MRCWISEPRILRPETSGPGWPPCAICDRTRSSVNSSAVTWISRSAIFSAKLWFSISGLPLSCSARAMSFSASTPRLDCGTAAMPSRSLASRNLAQVQPSFSLPTRFSTGTFTLSKKTSFTSWPPSAMMIGFTVMPGVFMSISRNEMPSCGFDFESVRTRQKIQSAQWPIVFQVFDPFTM